MSFHVGLFKYLSSDKGEKYNLQFYQKKKKIIHEEVAKSIHVGIYYITIVITVRIFTWQLSEFMIMHNFPLCGIHVKTHSDSETSTKINETLRMDYFVEILSPVYKLTN